MKTHQEFRSPLLAAALFSILLTLSACSDSTNEVQAQSVSGAGSTETVSYAEATGERVLARAKERWGLIVEAGKDQARWIEVYEFLAPIIRESRPITVYLPDRVKFHYDQPTKPKLLKLEEGKAYVAVTATWLAYKNARVRQAAGGDTLVKPFASIEEWNWVDGEWYLLRPHREGDFYRENPDFFKRKPTKKATAPQPNKAAASEPK